MESLSVFYSVLGGLPKRFAFLRFDSHQPPSVSFMANDPHFSNFDSANPQPPKHFESDAPIGFGSLDENGCSMTALSHVYQLKAGVAQAYYQLGRTYNTIGDVRKGSQTFRQADRLLNEVEAIQRIEQVFRD